MSERFELLATRIFETLKGYGYKLNVYDEEGNKIFVPRNGRAFFSQNEDLAVYIFENGIDSDIKIFLSGDDVGPFLKLLTNLRRTAIKYRVNFTVRKYGGSIKPKDFAFMAADIVAEGSDSMEHKIDEGMTGTSRTSYQKIGETRIVIKHTAPVKETHGSRGRNIKAIFIETPEGERLKYPYNHLLGARAMARHIDSEGSMRDSFGERIIGLSEDIRDLTKIGNHIWRTRAELDESSLEFRLVAREKVTSYKKALESLCRPRGYETTRSILEEDDAEKLPDQNTIDKMREALKLEENDEFDQPLAKLAIIVKEAESDSMDLTAPSEVTSRGFTDMDAGDVDDLVTDIRADKGLGSEEVEATGDQKAKIIRDAMGFTAGGDFANVSLKDLQLTAADSLVPGAEQWAQIKPHWEAIIKNGAPWGNPTDANWRKLNQLQEWVESLNKNLVGDAIKNIVLGAVLLRVSSALHAVMDKTLPSFDIIGAPFRKYLVPFFDLISGETVMETKTTGMPEEEQLNDWFESFDPDRFLAARKSQYANTIVERAEVIKESVDVEIEVETDTKKRSLTENQIWTAANKLAEASENERLIKNYHNAFTPDDFQKIMEAVRDTFKEELARKVVEDARRILKKKVNETPIEEDVVPFRPIERDTRSEETKYNDALEDQTGSRSDLGEIPCPYCDDVNCNFDCDEAQADGHNELDETVRDHIGQIHSSWRDAAVMYLVDTGTEPEEDYDIAYRFLKKNRRTEEEAQRIASEIAATSAEVLDTEMDTVHKMQQDKVVDPILSKIRTRASEIDTEMDEMEQGEESGIVIKHDPHTDFIDDITFDAEDPSEVPFKDELTGDMYETEDEMAPGTVIDEVVWIADKILDGDHYSLMWGNPVNLRNRAEVAEAAVRVYYGYEGEGLFPGARSADEVEELSQAVANRLVADITEASKTSRAGDIRHILNQIENI